MKPNIIVVYGGNSVEHEISIVTALQIKQNYTGRFNLVLCYLKDGNFYINDKLNHLKNYKDFKDKPIAFLANKNYVFVRKRKLLFEAVWVIAHGQNCEDGTIASYFKTLNIPVISQSLIASSIGQNKYISKKLTTVSSINSYLIGKNDLKNNMKMIINKANELSYPVILKPNSLGSSVGVSVIHSHEELIDKLEELFLLDEYVIMEKCLNNFIELNIAVLKYKDELLVSEIEKVSNNKVLTYNDKYVNENKSLNHSNKELPAKINKSLAKDIIDSAKNIYNDLMMSLVVRIDFLYDTTNEKLYFNEINNIPGSLAFYLFKFKDIDINQLVDMCIFEGLKQIENENNKIHTYSNNILNDCIFTNVKFCK